MEPGASPEEVGERIWPLVRAMAMNAAECGVDYLFVGDMLMPRHVVELGDRVGDEFRACYVGYRDVSPEQKLREISRYLSDECARLGLAYFDGSTSFEEAVEAATSYLRGPGTAQGGL